MSLTSMLKSKTKESQELKEIIDSIEINPMDFNHKICSLKNAEYFLRDFQDAALVGTAFDYLARFYFKRCEYIHKNKYKKDEYVAEVGLNIIDYSCEKKIYDANNNIYNIGLEVIEKYVKSVEETEELTKRLIGVSVFFAKLERIARGGLRDGYLDSLKYRITQDVETDLYNLFDIFKEAFENEFNILTKENKIIYNPTFDKCSVAVGGADADVIINDTLIDFKTIKNPTLTEEHLYQILGYFLFSKVIKRYGIKKVAFYYSRYGKFLIYDLKNIDKNNLKSAINNMDNFIEKLIENKM